MSPQQSRKRLPVLSEDIGDFQPMLAHLWQDTPSAVEMADVARFASSG